MWCAIGFGAGIEGVVERDDHPTDGGLARGEGSVRHGGAADGDRGRRRADDRARGRPQVEPGLLSGRPPPAARAGEQPQLDTIKKKARGDVDVRYIGRVLKSTTPWQRKRTRPLKIGVSVGHFEITAGTLGCFVRGLDPKDDRAVMILSNNHVLANENRAKLGDPVLQPGCVDGGEDPADKVATLSRFVRLKKTGANLVDAAVAALDAGIEFNAKTLASLGGSLAGVGLPFLDEGMPVGKIGRTTGTTRGKVTAFELDNVYVNCDIGNLQFNNQVEIEGDGDDPSARGATAAP